MANRPWNLALRFLLELAGLAAIGVWGWNAGTGGWRYLLAVSAPLAAAVLWGTLRVPDDASATKTAPVPVPGFARLLLELAFFGFATFGLAASRHTTLAWILGGLVAAHYALSYDRIIWLLGGKK